MPIVVDSQRLTEMEDQGFAVFTEVFSGEELESLDRALVAFLEKSRRDDQAREVDFGQKVAERDEFVRSFAERPEFLALATSFLGPDTDLYFNQMVYKNPEGATPFSWHQDDAYGPVEPLPVPHGLDSHNRCHARKWMPVRHARQLP